MVECSLLEEVVPGVEHNHLHLHLHGIPVAGCCHSRIVVAHCRNIVAEAVQLARRKVDSNLMAVDTSVGFAAVVAHIAHLPTWRNDGDECRSIVGVERRGRE